MKRCDIEIWKQLLDADGPVYTETLCCRLGMTRRQVLTRITGLNQEVIVRTNCDKDVSFTLNATPEQRINASADILAAFFRCDRSKIMTVADCVSIAGYMTLDEISALTQTPVREAAYILYVMPNIKMQKGTKKNYYTKRCDHVPVDLGTADVSA